MAGYSGTPLHKKLGIKPGDVVALIGAPEGWSIDPLPDGVVIRSRAAGALDVIVAFFDERIKLERRLPSLLPVVPADGSLWIAWPRRAAGHVSDITDNALRVLVLPTGLVDTKVAALDDNWSGLRFVWRRELRPSLRSAPRS